jgi:hypothetical protein
MNCNFLYNVDLYQSSKCFYAYEQYLVVNKYNTPTKNIIQKKNSKG